MATKRSKLTLLFLFTFLLASAQIRPFKFAQITDIHLKANDPKPTIDLLETIAQINATDGLDFVLVTGDIADEGDRETLLEVKRNLDLLRYKYYIILGNHETTWSDSGCTAFGDIFGSERFKFEHNGILFLGFNTGPLMRMAYGHVVPQDINWLKSEMDKYGKQQPVILVTHYPITEGDIDNWYDVTDAVRPYNIRLFIGGHYHAEKNLSYDGIPGILMRSNLRDKDGKPGYGIYEVTQDSIKVFTQRIGEDKRQWAAFSLTKQYFDHDGKAGKYPDFYVNNQYSNVKEKWNIQGEAGIYCSAATYGNMVFVGDDLGKLTAYNIKNGKHLWSFASGKRIIGDPAAADDIVVFGSADGNIYGLDAKTGKELWRVKAEKAVLGAVTISNGVAYIGASDNCFRAIDIKTGKVIWTYNNVKGYIVARPLVTSDKVIFGAWDNTLYALSLKDGKEMWQWKSPKGGMHYSPASVWPVAAHGKVFIADPERALTAIDINTGKTVWRTYASKVRESIGLSEDGERVYAKTMNDSVVCYSTASATPEQVWASNVAFGYEHAPSMPLEKEGIVFGGTKDGLIYALEGKTGKVIWKHKIGNSLVNTVHPIDKKQVIATSSDGKIVLLKTK